MKKIALTAAIAVLVLAYLSVYGVNEYESAIVTRFQKIVSVTDDPGAHVKMPLIDTVHRIDMRILPWDGPPTNVTTADKRVMKMDTFARWRITDPEKFYLAVRTKRRALSRIDDIVASAEKSVAGKHTSMELVRSDPNRVPETLEGGASDAHLVEIRRGRDDIQAKILAASTGPLDDIGIKIEDVRIKRVSFTPDVKQEIYKRMAAERNKISAEYISEGQAEAERINGQRELELKRIASEAYEKSRTIRGNADAEAAAIYTAAYSGEERERFYAFLKQLEVLEGAVKPGQKMFLTTDSAVYSALKGGER